jgi:hypothetical protein
MMINQFSGWASCLPQQGVSASFLAMPSHNLQLSPHFRPALHFWFHHYEIPNAYQTIPPRKKHTHPLELLKHGINLFGVFWDVCSIFLTFCSAS